MSLEWGDRDLVPIVGALLTNLKIIHGTKDDAIGYFDPIVQSIGKSLGCGRDR